MPAMNDWMEIPTDIRLAFWPACKETLFVVEREHLFDESMKFSAPGLIFKTGKGIKSTRMILGPLDIQAAPHYQYTGTSW